MDVSIMDFLHSIEKLKNEMRHSYTSNGRQESVAEHCWRLGIMVIVLAPQAREKLDIGKCLKIALVHDLPEVFAGDTYALGGIDKKEKSLREAEAMKKLTEIIGGDTGKEMWDIWREYEDLDTKEARFVKLLDKLEVLVQHNEAPLDTWDDIERKYQYGMARRHSSKFGFLQEFAGLIDKEMKNKLETAGLRPDEISESDYTRFFGAKGPKNL